MSSPAAEEYPGDLTSDDDEVMIQHDDDDGNNEDLMDLEDEDPLCIDPYELYDRDALAQPAFPG